MKTINRCVRSLLAATVLTMFVAVPLKAQEYTVNLKETDIQELIKFVAEATGTTIVVDPAVKGKVKVVSSKPVSRNELYDLFLSILEVHGYTAVRAGGVVRVIQNKDARSSPVAVRDQGAGLPTDEYITQVIRLENISAAKLIPVLRPLVPQQAHMAAYAPSNAIIISDVAANIERISEIISRMDRTAVQQTDIVTLRYAVAEDVVRMLERLTQSEAKSGGTESELFLVADKRTNSVLVNGDELERARMRKLINHLDTPLEQSGNVKVIYLEYADAKAIAEVLTRVVKNIAELDGGEGKQPATRKSGATIEADEGTNALIITANPGEMAALEAVVQRLDIRRAQVLVEAIIVELQVTDGQELGLQWLFANDSGVFGSSINSGIAAELGDGILPDRNEDDRPADEFDLTDVAAALAGTSGFTLGWGSLDDDLTMAVILNALAGNDDANILSTPSLLTLDNQEAYITVGQNVPFVTGSYTSTGTGDGASNPFQTIQREDVGITLKVTPHVNEGDAVVLDIEQEVSAVLPGGQLLASDIITSERKILTKVLARDRSVVVLGGLVEDDVQTESQKVPLLGDIPLLGRLFRNDRVTVTKRNLLVFIRPTIIRDDEQIAGATAEKYRHIREQQVQRREQGLMFLDDDYLPVLPEWEEQIQQLEQIKESDALPEEG